ncbi:MAG: protein-L-isoaspartate(D-aspartate) O-methyltransferase [Burkholderiales bacterium]|nr:protein-L-isoaspartate(D-aspartate) O-methyltransferase [Burkholderiales bacterium]
MRLETRSRIAATALVVAALVAPGLAAAQDPHAAARRAMVDEIRASTRETASATGVRELSERVTAAMGRVPRHEFVPPSLAAQAYANRPLPIGAGQTISQPFIVALMTELAAPGPGSRVLEVGTGSGYQAAILAELAGEVYSIEIVESLARRAGETLGRLGYRNIRLRVGDGYRGWPEAAPFDAIVVTAAPDHVPPALVEQLKPGGRLVIPVGPQSAVQELMVIEKLPDGRTVETRKLPVRFVPLVRERKPEGR